MGSREPIRIVIIEQHVLRRAALRCLLETEPVCSVVGESDSMAGARSVVSSLRPDVILLDTEVAGQSTLPLLAELLSACDRTRAVVVTAARDAEVHLEAVQSGAMGLVSVDDPPEDLINAIERVHAGEVWLDRMTTAGVISRFTRGRAAAPSPDAVKIEALTRREREVVTLVAEGLKNRHIAERLMISEATVRNHMTSILDKLDLGDRFELAVYAFRKGLATQTDGGGPAMRQQTGM